MAMALEIERKFLLNELPDLHDVEGVAMVQGYLRADAGGSVRVRIAGDTARLTIKGPGGNLGRLEFEYSIPPEEARAMLNAVAVGELVEKVRYRIGYEGYVWEVDVFSGRNAGLVLAEVELGSVGDELRLPSWVGREVSDDPRFFNARLARRPYQDWGDEPTAG